MCQECVRCQDVITKVSYGVRQVSEGVRNVSNGFRKVSGVSLSLQILKHHKSQTVRARNLKILENVHPPPCVTCQVSHVKCQVSIVRCQVSGVIILNPRNYIENQVLMESASDCNCDSCDSTHGTNYKITVWPQRAKGFTDLHNIYKLTSYVNL